MCSALPNSFHVYMIQYNMQHPIESAAATIVSQPHLLQVFILVVAMCAGAALAGRIHDSLLTPLALQHKPKPNSTAEYLAAHNQARAEVGVEPLRWSLKLVAEATRLVRYERKTKQCLYNDDGSVPYGLNQVWSSDPITPRAVVGLWLDEKSNYNHTDNTCSMFASCLSYTQVVWRKTTELGCAQIHCGKRKRASLTICLYNPRGNVPGESPY